MRRSDGLQKMLLNMHICHLHNLSYNQQAHILEQYSILVYYTDTLFPSFRLFSSDNLLLSVYNRYLTVRLKILHRFYERAPLGLNPHHIPIGESFLVSQPKFHDFLTISTQNIEA